MDSLIAKIPTTSISWQSLHFICRAWWLTGRFLTYLKINDMERTMLSHLMSQAHPVRLFLGFSSIKPPRVLFPLSLQVHRLVTTIPPPPPLLHTHYQAIMSLTCRGIGRSWRRVPRIAPAPSDQWDFLLLVWQQNSCNDKIIHYCLNGRFSGREWRITLGGGRGHILMRDTCGWKVNLLLLENCFQQRLVIKKGISKSIQYHYPW